MPLFFRVSSSFFGVGSGSVSVSLVAALFLHLVFALSSACFLFVRILGCFRLSAIFFLFKFSLVRVKVLGYGAFFRE